MLLLCGDLESADPQPKQQADQITLFDMGNHEALQFPLTFPLSVKK